MRYFVFLLLIVLSCNSNKLLNNSDIRQTKRVSPADIFVINKLLYFDSLINGNKIDPQFHNMLGQRIEANTQYMERLTKINSTGRADHYGRKNVSIETYTEWVRWYLKNKENLSWDSKKNEAVFK
jgi:hypothetical protein